MSGSTDAVHRATAVFGSLTVAQRQSWRDQILPESRDSIVSLAKIDESVRNALVALSPIAVTKPSYSGDLSLYDSSTGLGALTDAWLRDRASFLTWERLYRNAGQTDGVFEMPGGLPVPISGDILYNDGASGYQLRIDGIDNFVVPTQLVTFGGIGNDVLSGNTADDHLYGGGGVDIIHGGDGDDYVQGDAGNDEMFGDNNDDLLLGMDGNDKLDGGEGMDSLQGGRGDDELKGGDGAYFDLLYGGEGDDTLIGGKGDDFLSGDEGNDTYKYTTYKYTTGDGRDTIKDIDGLGSILFDGQAMSVALGYDRVVPRPTAAELEI